MFALGYGDSVCKMRLTRVGLTKVRCHFSRFSVALLNDQVSCLLEGYWISIAYICGPQIL